jgi:hypothetical protein
MTANQANDTTATLDIAAGGVTTTKIADKAVTEAKIADSAVTTAKIKDKAVTEAKLSEDLQTKITGFGTLATDLRDGSVKAGDADKLDGHDSSYFAVASEVGPVLTGLSHSTGDKYVGVTYSTGQLQIGALWENNYTPKNDGFHKVADTGNVNDLVQTTGDYLIFNCGTSSTII